MFRGWATWVGLHVGLACLGLSGCTFADPAFGVVNTCSGRGDCGTNELCDDGLGMCVSASKAGYQVVLRVTSSHGETGPRVPPSRFQPFTLGGPVVYRDLVVPEAVQVRGLVARKIGQGRSRSLLIAELLWTPLELTSGPEAETVSVTTASDLQLSEQGESSNFAVSLLADTDYMLTVRPLSEAAQLAPPLEMTLTSEELTAGAIEIVYDKLQPLKGVLLTADREPQPGLVIRAVEPESGRVLSSLGFSDEQGQFTLYLDQMVGEDLPVLEVGPAGENTWFGVIRSDPDLVRNLDDGRVEFVLPMLPELVKVEGWVEAGGSLERVRGAALTFGATVHLNASDGRELPVIVSQRAESASGAGAGRFDTVLWPGEYEVVVMPPPDAARLAPKIASGFQVVSQPDMFPQSGVTFSLDRRTEYRGLVLDSEGRILPNVVTRLSPRVPAEGDEWPELTQYSRSSFGTTGELGLPRMDSVGEYRLLADIGVYDMVFEPPSGSGFPWLVIPDQPVLGLGEERRLDVQLPSPIALSGAVTFAGRGTPEGAVVSAFAPVEDPVNGATRYVQIGRAAVGEDGSYRLFLPPYAPTRAGP